MRPRLLAAAELSKNLGKVVPATGLEPVQCYLLEPESSASANSATRATDKPARTPYQTACELQASEFEDSMKGHGRSVQFTNGSQTRSESAAMAKFSPRIWKIVALINGTSPSRLEMRRKKAKAKKLKLGCLGRKVIVRMFTVICRNLPYFGSENGDPHRPPAPRRRLKS
jgi:hypothetical protein